MSQNPKFPGPRPDDYVVCPYNKFHCMRPNRLALHLISCSRNYPSEKMVRCIFNSTHVHTVDEMKTHLEICPNRITVCLNPVPEKEPQPPNFCVESTEDWDAEPPAATYDPTAHCDYAFVIRNPQGNPPAARRAFRARERIRFIENNKF